MAKIKAVIFDIDNTLIDFWKFKSKCIDSAIDAMINAGLKIKKDEARKIIYKLFEEFGMEHKYIFQKFLIKALGKIDYRLLSYALLAYRKMRSDLLVPYPGVKETISRLNKKYKTAIISDAPREKAWLRLVLMEIDSLYDVVVTFEDTKKRKPNKMPFLVALKKLGIKPEEALFVGDSISRDMIGGKSVGMKTALALYGRKLIPRKKPEEVDYMLKKISDLISILKQNS